MKLNDSTLRGKLKKYLEGNKFQKQYAEQLQFKSYKWYWDESDIEDIVRKLKRKIWLAAEILVTREFSGSSRLAGADPNYLLSHRIVRSSIKRDPTNNRWITACKVELFFNPDFVRSASLYPQGYPDGVDNIVRLLTNGWDFRTKMDRNPNAITNLYRGRMHGDWHLGSPKSRNIIKNVYAVTYNRGSSLLFSYVNEFNSEEDGVFATLNETYRNAFGIGGLRASYNKSGNSQIDSWDISGIGTIRFGLKL